MSAREYVFMLQNCASECVNNRTYRTLQETCDEGAPCSSGQGSEALIGSLHIQALPTNRQKTRTCCCTCSCYKILCCNMPSDKNFFRKRACVRPRFKEHCAGGSTMCGSPTVSSNRLYCCLPNFDRCGRSQDRVWANCPLVHPLYIRLSGWLRHHFRC